MKKIAIVVTCVFFFISSSLAQTGSDSIEIIKKFGGAEFYQNNKRLRMADLENTMKTNEQALKHIQAARTNNTVASIFGFIGGFAIGWPIGTAIGGGDPNWAMAGVGAGLIVVSIPFTASANKHARTAVNIYNESLKQSSFLNKPKIYLCFRGNSIGLSVHL